MAKVEADEAAEKAKLDAEETAKRLGLPSAVTEVETSRRGRDSGSGGGAHKRAREERTREDGVPLGQGATERMGDQPFYLQVPVHRQRPQVQGEGGGVVERQEGCAGADTATAAASAAVTAIVAAPAESMQVRGHVVHGAQAAAARVRDDRRKTAQDPTRAFMPTLTDQEQDQAWGGNDAPFNGSKEGAGPSPAPSFAGARARARALARELAAPPSASASAPVKAITQTEAPWDMDALRQKRLRRELRERRRAALLFRE
jgi:hypothetical protein